VRSLGSPGESTGNSSSAGALATYTYSYNSASEITQYKGPEGTLTYTYDNSGELTGVGDSESYSYSYDLNGNRNSSGYTTGSDNTLTGDGTYTYAYDANGNMTSQTNVSSGQLTQYTWDYHNRLTNVLVKTSAGVTVTNETFTYDVDNRRIGDDLNGTQGWTAYDHYNPYADFNSGGTLTYRYLYGRAIDTLFARYSGTTANWYLTDNIGSVRQLVTTTGTVQDQLTYDPFGNILTESNSSNGDRFKYTSEPWDSSIGLQYNLNRYYNPNDGRWISQDPQGFAAGDPDLYRYVANQPSISVDPSGLQQLPSYVPLGLPKDLPPLYDYALQDVTGTGNHGPNWYDDNPGKQVITSPYVQMGYQGNFQQPRPKYPTNTTPGEIQWIVPIYPGRKLYFKDVNPLAKPVKGTVIGIYLGGSGPGGKGGYKPTGSPIVVDLTPGMGLLFEAHGSDTGTDTGRFLGTKPGDFTPGDGQILIIVPKAR